MCTPFPRSPRHSLRTLALAPGLAALLALACGGESTNGATVLPSVAADGAGTPAPQACPTTVSPSAGLALTREGAVQGARAGETWAFKGIPFAAPPAGERRWQPPTPAPCRSSTLEATAFGPACPQLEESQLIGDEDCLYLNVWTPAAPRTQGPLPVMVFLHGGGNVQGATGERLPDGSFLYDGGLLSQKGNVVMVTAAYRLGPLGFLVHPALAGENPHGSAGNYGLLDQIAALRWLQANVAAFGGDPARVMVFGESAGAVDTCMLLVSPLAKGLFSRALMESGACVAAPRALRESEGKTVAEKAGCASAPSPAACLRALSAEAILRAVPGTVSVATPELNNYGPVVDGYVIPDAPRDLLAEGKHNRMPFIAGNNSDETSRSIPRIQGCEAYAAAVRGFFPAIAARIIEVYPCASYASPQKALTAVTSDPRFVCTARLAVRAAANGQDEPIYRFQYSHTIDSPLTRQFGAFHGAEVLFVFQNLGIGGYRPSAADEAVADAFLGYWTRFAATGDPNGSGLPAWPRYDASRDTYLDIAAKITAGEGLRTRECDFWERVAP